jgi:hypothetical protein
MKIKKINGFLNFFLSGGVIGITLWPFGIYFRDPAKMTKNDKNHEEIHWEQQKEMAGIFFYLWYIIEWSIKILIYGGNSYYNISFERESYLNEKNLNYLSARKRFNWVKYIFKKTG